MPGSLLVGAALALIAYVLVVCALMATGRWADARAVVRFLPDCIVLLRRLFGDRRVPRGRKIVLAAALGYVALPIDLIPEPIPILGLLDDVLAVALAVRLVLAGAGPAIVAEHWPGPRSSLRVLLRLALIGVGTAATRARARPPSARARRGGSARFSRGSSSGSSGRFAQR